MAGNATTITHQRLELVELSPKLPPNIGRIRRIKETVDVCRKHGIAEATLYKYEAKYGGMDVTDAGNLKALENKNAKLKKPLAEALPENTVLKGLSENWLGNLDPARPAFQSEKLNEISASR